MSLVTDPLWTTFVVILPLTAVYFWVKTKDDTNEKAARCGIPWAPGRIPLLGHALAYQKDPSGFLLRSCQTVGNIFQLNLAGKHMVIVAGMEEQRQIARTTEGLMSARQGVADVGFEETLGLLNVHKGTDLHKGIIKGAWTKDPTNQLVAWKVSLENAIRTEVELSKDGEKVEFFHFVRRVALRATIDRFISPDFLEGLDDQFLKDYMVFQDELEDATAKAAVLPKWLAVPALLSSVRTKRRRLQLQIVGRLKPLLSKESTTRGFWLSEVYPEHSLEDIAQYIVGLLFAAHKNPAIGAAQAYLMMFEECSKEVQDSCRADAEKFLDPELKWEALSDSCPTLRKLCLETLRLTAHSIGGVRKVQKDFDIKTSSGQVYTIPRGLSVGLTHITPSLNPELWGANASKLDVNAHSLESYQDEYRFTTFSHGVHKCPGQQLALVILQGTVALLLQSHEITLPDKIPPLSFERATLAQREGPVLVTIQKRSQ